MPRICLPFVRAVSVLAVVTAAATGCTHVDVKGRELFRLGPLRDAVVSAASVEERPVPIDAGTDALTDEELDVIARALPTALRGSVDRVATEHRARRLGVAQIQGCRLRAGPGKTATLYVARCRVRLSVDDVTVIEVQTEALRRAPVKPVSEEEAAEIRKIVREKGRNPLLSADDSRRALEAALEGAALLLVDGALPPAENGPPAPRVVPRAEKAALARDRIARPGDPRAALFDLRSSGLPDDAGRAMPFLSHADPAVRVAAVDALGELCAAWTAEKIEPLTVPDVDTAEVRAAAARALERLRVCGKLGGP